MAEGLFGMAASLSDRASADVSILYLRMALYLRPDLALADLLLADRFESLGKYSDAVAIYRQIDKSSAYYRMAATQAAINEIRLGQKTEAISDLRNLAEAFPPTPRIGSRWATPIATRKIIRLPPKPMITPKKPSAPRTRMTGRSFMPGPWRKMPPTTGTRPKPISIWR